MQEEKAYFPQNRISPISLPMDAVRQLILDKVDNLAEMSRRIGRNHAYLFQFVHRGSPRELQERDREKLAMELGVSQSLLRVNHGTGTPETFVDPLRTAADTQKPPSGALSGNRLTGERDLPVFGIAQGGLGALILSNEAVDMVVRPDPLLRVKDGYGVIVVGDSMEPELGSGDIALVNPHLPPRASDTCVFRQEAEDGSQIACIKRLRRVTDTAWHVTEWNSAAGGPRDFTLKKSEWPLCHVTVGSYKRR